MRAGRKFVALGFGAVILLAGPVLAAPLPLVSEGNPSLPIRISENASDRTRQAAEDLARILGQMSGATIAVTTEAGPALTLGTVEEFPELVGKVDFQPADPLRREDYLLKTLATTGLLLGATDYAVEMGVWDILARLGYRQYFPHAAWEIIPRRDSLTVDWDEFVRPSFSVRVIWINWGRWKDSSDDFEQWTRKNRLSQGAFQLRTGHTYDAIIKFGAAEIAADPSILSEVDGKPTNKLNAGNPAAVALAIAAKEAEVAKLRKKGRRVDSVSMDPSDGGGWGESEAEQAIGSPSDRVVFLANAVQQALDLPVGIYAYNEHASAPARQKVAPRVIVSFATTFIKGGRSLEQNMKDWVEAGAQMLGIREYFSVYAWDADLPAYPQASKLDHLAATIPEFYRRGARFFTAESGENFAPAGLGYYLAAQKLWKVDSALDRTSLLEEFVANCFPEARAPMERLLVEIFYPPGGRRVLMNDDLLARLFRGLDEARRLTTDPAARARIDQLVLYARHLANVRRYEKARQSKDETRQQAFEEMLKFSWRIREFGLIHSFAQWRTEQHRRSKARTGNIVPPDADWSVEESINPWKSSAPFTTEEIESLLRDGVARHELLDFEPVSYSRHLVSACPLLASPDEPSDLEPFRMPLRRETLIFTEVAPDDLTVRFTATPGQIYQTLGPTEFALFSLADGAAPMGQEEGAEVPLFAAPDTAVQLPSNGTGQDVVLTAGQPGLVAIRHRDQSSATVVNWPADRPFTLEYSLDAAPPHLHRYKLVFYVPRNTREVAGFATGKGRVLTPDGQEVFKLRGENEYVKIPVPSGMDGAFWTFEAANGTLRLMTVPPFMAPTPGQLLLPQEVVEADRRVHD